MENLGQYIIYFWGTISIIMVILEIALTGIMQIWFAIGALIAGIVAWFYPTSYLIQILTFLGSSGILLFIGSLIFKDKKGDDSRNFNRVYSILDKVGTVTKEINTATGEGQISVNGDKWSAKSKNDTIIPENTKVKIIDIDGVKAVVEAINE